MTTRRKMTRIALAFAVVMTTASGLIAVLPGVGAMPAFAATEPAPESRATPAVALPSFADVFERVRPSVVTVTTERGTRISPTAGVPGIPSLGDPSLDEFFGHFFGRPGMPMHEMPSRALGSGLILDNDGYIVTNNHVVDGADEITVTLGDGKDLPASVVGTDPKTDIALLKIEAGSEKLVPVTLGDSDRVRVGEWVLAVGNPFGLGDTATVGIVSAIGRDIQSGPYDNFLQIDAPINSGNSGGPVFNTEGQVIGVNTAIYSPNGGNVGIGFAIPIAQVRNVAASLRDQGFVSRGWLGVQIQAVDEDLAENLNIRPDNGVLVSQVQKNSPAARAELQPGDVIEKFDGKDVDSPKALSRMVADSGPSSKIQLTINRDGKRRDIRVLLGEADSQNSLVAQTGKGAKSSSDELGLTVAQLNRDFRDRLGLDDDAVGLVITNVVPGGVASEKGVRPGDLILSVNGRDTASVAEFEAALESARSAGDSARLLVRRDDSQQFVVVGLS